MEAATTGYRNKEVLLKTDDHEFYEKKFTRWESFTQDEYYYVEAILEQYT